MRGISVASNPSPIMVTLPKTSGGFRWVQPFGSAPFDSAPFDSAQGTLALMCDALEPLASHFFTTRSWKLGERTPESGNGWMDVALAANVGVEHFRRLHQVHGADAVAYKKGERAPGGALPHADITLTYDPGVA